MAEEGGRGRCQCWRVLRDEGGVGAGGADNVVIGLPTVGGSGIGDDVCDSRESEVVLM